MRRTLALVCLASCWLQTSAFFGFSWGSEDVEWNLCGGVSDDLTCKCPVDVLEAYHVGLDCSDCNIGHLNDGLFVPLHFKKVDLSNNHIKNISRDTFATNNSHITDLDLAANLLWSIPSETFAHLPGLTKLDLSNNEIAIITRDSFKGIENLTWLDISHNHLKVLEADMFGLVPKLVDLMIKYNPVKVLPDSLLNGLIDLKSLDLTHLQLKALHYDLFNDTASLEILNLAFNDMEMVPTKALFQLSSSLRVLDLTGNFFTELKSNSIYRMERLHELYLQQLIYLRSIHESAIYETNNLRTLKLQLLPRIQFISALAFSSGSDAHHQQIPLQDFTLSYTRLEKFPEKLLNWSNLKYLELQHNQWRCDCDFAWIKGSQVEELAGDSFYCSSPRRLHGAPLALLQKEDFVCKVTDELPDKKQWGVVALVLILGVVASIVTVSVLFYRRHGYLFRRHDNYNQLSAVSRESITVVDNSSATSNTDAEINVS